MQYTHHRHEVSAPLLTPATFFSYITGVCTVTHFKTDRRLLSVAAAEGELSNKISQDVEEEWATTAVSKAVSHRGASITLFVRAAKVRPHGEEEEESQRAAWLFSKTKRP